MFKWLCSMLVGLMAGQTAWSEETREGFPRVLCKAEQTGGFHDYPEEGEAYEPALFHPQQFSLEENLVFMLNLAADERNVDVYLTMTSEVTQADGATVEEATELECREVRGAGGGYGLS